MKYYDRLMIVLCILFILFGLVGLVLVASGWSRLSEEFDLLNVVFGGIGYFCVFAWVIRVSLRNIRNRELMGNANIDHPEKMS